MIREMPYLLLKYKNPAFREEKETRLIYDVGRSFEDVIDKHKAFIQPVEKLQLDVDYRIAGNSKKTEYYKDYSHREKT